MKTRCPLCFRNAAAFFVLLLTLTANIFAQPQYYNFTGGTSNNAFPFNTLSATGKTIQTLYLPGAFSNPSPAPNGNIIKFYVQPVSSGSVTYTQLTIKMGLTTDTDLPTAAWYTGPMTTVFDQSNYAMTTTADQFIGITLTTPFNYDATKSLVVEITQCGYSGTGFGVRNTGLSGLKRNAGPLTGTACPHPYGNQSAIMTHSGVDIAPPSVTCSYSWANQTSGVTSLFYTVKAVSGTVGWAAGAGAIVRRTTDGGATWGNGNPNPGVIVGDIYNIEALDANTAFVTTSAASTFIYRTTNGGANWTQVYTIAGGFINTIKMVSATNGYAFGDVLSGTWLMLRTTDGGATWSALPTAPTGGAEDGRNNCLQILGNNIWFGTGQNKVYRSTDLGVTWTNATVTGITGQITGIQFNTPLIGIVGGATMSKTTDGGATWTLLAALGTGTISGIEGLGDDYWYVRGTGIYRSTNLGVSWASVHTHTAAQNDLYFALDGNGCLTGWSAGTTGTIAKMTGVPVGINDPVSEIPSSFKLEQNYPNPFNPTTNITFALPVSGNVELKIYDAIGREVATLVNAFVNAGTHIVPFDASALSSGVYIYKINTGSFTDSKKMVLIK